MPAKKRARVQNTEELDESAAQGNVDAKRELARRLMEKGAEQNEEKVVPLLEDCVARGDADAMLMLAKCCAYGLGTKQNVERAKALISEAAENGNNEARSVMDLLDECDEQDIELKGLLLVSDMHSELDLSRNNEHQLVALEA